MCAFVVSRHLSCVQFFATLWTLACQALLPMGFSRQEYWRGLPFPPPGDPPNPGIEPTSPTLQADSLPLTYRVSPLINVVVVQLLKCVQLFVTPWTAARQAFLSFTISRSLLRLVSIESMTASKHLILLNKY